MRKSILGRGVIATAAGLAALAFSASAFAVGEVGQVVKAEHVKQVEVMKAAQGSPIEMVLGDVRPMAVAPAPTWRSTQEGAIHQAAMKPDNSGSKVMGIQAEASAVARHLRL